MANQITETLGFSKSTKNKHVFQASPAEFRKSAIETIYVKKEAFNGVKNPEQAKVKITIEVLE